MWSCRSPTARESRRNCRAAPQATTRRPPCVRHTAWLRGRLRDPAASTMAAMKKRRRARARRRPRIQSRVELARRLHAVEDFAFDVLDTGRHRRIPLDVLERGLGKALREL